MEFFNHKFFKLNLHFINIDNIYSSTNHEPSHYIMNGVVMTVELKPTDFHRPPKLGRAHP